ncbi:MAG: YbaB/EbfC family nucleoid-associated protein [Xanthomonadales bacterium]|jgi:DNA-binding YbaB/EbfC family protein|nr:YbaB/EbfC family nucleoid-associated protein [Xanthomonadales bacterium]
MKANLAGLMQQAQKMQEEMKKAEQELANVEVTGEAGGGMVKITINGRHEFRRVEIDPSAMDDRELLEDLISAAANHAVQQVAEKNKDKMSSLTSGLPIPPGFPFKF